MTIQDLAHDLLEALRYGCERIEIAGSIRRGKADPKDIELVAIPIIQMGTDYNDMFGGDVEENLLLEKLDSLYSGKEWELDRVVKRNGPKYKRLRHIESGTCCDLFITTPESWGVIFTIRTGPADFSKELVTRALRRSMKVDGGQLWRTHRDDTRTVVATPTEAAFFEALGLPYLEPAERTTRALMALSMKAAR